MSPHASRRLLFCRCQPERGQGERVLQRRPGRRHHRRPDPGAGAAGDGADFGLRLPRKEQDIREIGARLNVENILEGSVRRSGNRVRVTAQLVKASDGYHLWSQRFDREMTDVFAIQDEISQAIVEKLRVRLAGDCPMVKRYTENLAAYDLCLKARSAPAEDDTGRTRGRTEVL